MAPALDQFDMIADVTRIGHAALAQRIYQSTAGGLPISERALAVIAGQLAAMAEFAAAAAEFAGGEAMLRGLHEQLDQSWCDAQRILSEGRG